MQIVLFRVNDSKMEIKKRKTISVIMPRDTGDSKIRSVAYSRFIYTMRFVLPLFVFMVFILLMVWPAIKAQKITAKMAESVPNLVVENLKFSGLDTKNQPYSLTAARALQSTDSINFTDLEKPQGEFSLNNGSWLSGQADLGRFDQLNKRLWLGGGVRLFYDRGLQFSTSELQLDIGKNLAWSKKPVLIQGDFGEIQGQGFYVMDSGNVVVITGKSRALLNLQGSGISDKSLNKK